MGTLRYLFVILCVLCGVACQGVETRGAEFRTLAACLQSIPLAARSSLGQLTRDTPQSVAGLLANGQHFACERRESGTKGIHYFGWYTVQREARG